MPSEPALFPSAPPWRQSLGAKLGELWIKLSKAVCDKYFSRTNFGSKKTPWAGSCTEPKVLTCGRDGAASASQSECQTTSVHAWT